MKLRPRLSPTMDRFLALQFLGPFLVCLTAFTAAYLLGDVFGRFDDLLHYGGLGLLGVEYFALKLPLMVTQLLPIACLAGVLLGFALLNRSGEVLACQQLGISRLEMMVPVLLVAAAISLFDFAVSETVVPLATREARYLYNVQLKKRHQNAVFADHHIWVRTRSGFLSAETYQRRKDLLLGVTAYHINPDFKVKRIFHAKSARWDGRGWKTADVTRYTLEPGGTVRTAKADGLKIDVKLSDLNMLRLDPEEFSLWELDRYISQLRSEGLNPGGYLVDRDLKYAMPLACLIMVALGIALSLDPLPRNLSLGRSFGLAIAIGFGYWLSLGITTSLGESQLLPPWFAAWSPNALFAILAVGIFMFGEER